MIDTQRPESTSPINKYALRANHSTSQLIPGCRAQILRAKKENLRRKINQVADQIFSLKYDTQHQTQQLHKLTQKGQKIYKIASANLQKVKADLQEVVKPICLENESISIDLKEIKNLKSQASDRSTNISVLTERKSQPLKQSSQVDIQAISKPRNLRRHQIFHSLDSKIKPLDLKKISMRQQQSYAHKKAAQISERHLSKSMKIELVRQTPIASIFIIMVGVIVIILLI